MAKKIRAFDKIDVTTEVIWTQTVIFSRNTNARQQSTANIQQKQDHLKGKDLFTLRQLCIAFVGHKW